MGYYTDDQIYKLTQDGEYEKVKAIIKNQAWSDPDKLNALIKVVLTERSQHSDPYDGPEEYLENRYFLDFLFDQGADITFDNNWALHHTVNNCDDAYVTLCIENGADPNAHGGEAIDRAFKTTVSTLLKQIVQRGGDLNLAEHEIVKDYLTGEFLRPAELKLCFENGISAKNYAPCIMSTEYKDKERTKDLHNIAHNFSFIECLIAEGEIPQPDLSKSLADQEISMEFDFNTGFIQLKGTYETDGFNAMLLSGRLGEAMTELPENYLDMNNEYAMGASIQHILRLTNQLDVPFQSKFWQERDLAELDNMYQTLNPSNKAIAYKAYSYTREEIAIKRAMNKGLGVHAVQIKRRSKNSL